ncbi:uncharacterized protein TRIADDRAFT_51494 [Trichoplax adhaerens]|uniref:Major facilitator superfamily (MFS) profile domain-containing protein n=1 Tax=Trichoplax adhaerens TaxID=10228 RepID=B3RJD0_TRIAD|nr:hypothetical protein TRIADDRAFT_51494 [Trichoplax adhaerens]EDV29310.1 hypothetical protein TRIADDRAFT_51494 [Trichoplax adhaerens]|eukprot:XP_002108512.1 hypothetical protein TRIADDRAFT_51494 [Trichoplax adhaerens]
MKGETVILSELNCQQYKNSKEEGRIADHDDDMDSEDEKELSRLKKAILLIILYFTNIAIGMAYVILTPFFSVLAKNKGVHPYEISIIFAMYPFTKFFLSIIVGILLPRIGIKTAIWIGLVLDGGSLIIFGMLDQIIDRNIFVIFCIITRALQGVGAAFYLTAGVVFIISIQKNAIASSVGLSEFSLSLGMILGPIIGGVLYQYRGFKAPFLAIGILLIIISFAVIKFPSIYPLGFGQAQSFRTTMEILTIPRVMVLYIAMTLINTYIGYLEPSIAFHLKPFHLSESEIGAVFGAFPLTYMMFTIIVGYVTDKMGKYRWINICGMIICGIAYQFLGPAPYLKMHQSLVMTVTSLAFLGLGAASSLVATYPDMVEVLVAR